MSRPLHGKMKIDVVRQGEIAGANSPPTRRREGLRRGCAGRVSVGGPAFRFLRRIESRLDVALCLQPSSQKSSNVTKYVLVVCKVSSSTEFLNEPFFFPTAQKTLPLSLRSVFYPFIVKPDLNFNSLSNQRLIHIQRCGVDSRVRSKLWEVYCKLTHSHWIRATLTFSD